MDFPIAELMDEYACYAKLLSWLLPDGLACPRCGARDGLGVHRHHRAPVLDYRCTACKRVFNIFTGTPLQGTQRRPVAPVLILRGCAQGASTARLARELFQECRRCHSTRREREADRRFVFPGQRRQAGEAAGFVQRDAVPSVFQSDTDGCHYG